MEKSLAMVMKNASTAIYLDSENRLVEAYVQYLQCLSSIATQLLENATEIGYELVASKPIQKYVQLGQQCMERIGIILDKLGENPTRSQRKKSDAFNTETEILNTLSGIPGSVSTASNPVAVISGAQILQPAIVNSAEDVYLISTPPLVDSTGSYRKPVLIGPMELAYRYNQQLLNAYRSRTARMNHAAASTLNLTVQRKMAENLAIAKRQEAALEKKMKERQQRLEEQATRRFSVPTGMSKKEQEQRQTYKQILAYEQDMKWLAEWRRKLDENPTDEVLIHQLITEILKCADHPLTLLIKKYQYKLCQALSPLVVKKIGELEDVRVSIDETEKNVPNISELLSAAARGSNSNSSPNVNNSTSESDSKKSVQKDSKSREITDDDDAVNDKVTDKGEKEGKREGGNGDVKDGGVKGRGSEIMTPTDVCNQIKDDLETAIAKGDDLTDKLKSERKILTKMASKSMEKSVEDYEDEISNEIWGDDEEVGDIGELKSPSNENGDTKPRSDSMGSTESVDSHTQKWQSLYSQSEDSQSLDSMKNEAYARHLKWISQDVHSYMEEIQVMFIVAYEKLDSLVGRDQCQASLEEPFFKPIWAHLLALFRLANLPKEHALAEVMSKYHSVSPKDVGVRPKLCLTLPPGENEENYLPYRPAITELRRVSDSFSPLNKLECLVRVSKCACQCVEEYYKNTAKDSSKKQPNIGADDLLPILTYVIIRSRLPQVVSECQAMEEFIHEGYLMGEEGYCLTSVQTAINYIVSIHKRAIAKQ
ncbi:VPS9 domain-containing protein 1-like [Liolophura sinensis]|uniref:VPS9 domain-containing protein 1-like n=1 Tax=Liolophura sinensis TaxID=3198878 RepID=UPI0031589BC2